MTTSVSHRVDRRPAGIVDRIRPLLGELTKFVVVGGGATVLDIVLANVLHFRAGVGPTVAKTLSTIVATVASYYANRLWAFSHRVDAQAGHRHDMTFFAVINVLGLLITLVPVDFAEYVLHQRSVWAFNLSGLIGTVAATAFRFWSYRRFVFTKDAAERNALV